MKHFGVVAGVLLLVCFALYQLQRTAASKPLPVSFAFLIADIKWQPGALKVLELGEGPQSQFQGFDVLYGMGTVWATFWTYLQHYKVPIWYIGNVPQRPQELAFEQFFAQGGRAISSLKELERDSFFQQCLQKRISDEQCISSYRGILVFSNHGYPNWYGDELVTFQKQYPGFIVVNEAATPYVNHKKNTSRLFTEDLSVYRPRWSCYKKCYYQTLQQDITVTLASPIVVIKPLNAANGWGNLIVSEDMLDATLKKLLITPHELKNELSMSWRYWADDGHEEFLVEELVHSKPVVVAGKRFDGTMRVVFVLEHEGGKTAMTILGYCWKLPGKSIDEVGTLSERYKSAYAAAQVSCRDQQEVSQMLLHLIPRLYKKMLYKN